VPNRILQYSIGKENLYYLYRFIVLPWELDWSSCKFLISEGNLKEYCDNHRIIIKSFDSTDKLSKAIASNYQTEEANCKGMLWFVRQDTKPKDTLRHLRNCAAHGNYRKRQINGVSCFAINNLDRNITKARGFIPLELLKGLVCAAESCKV